IGAVLQHRLARIAVLRQALLDPCLWAASRIFYESRLPHGAQDLLVGHAWLWRTLAVIEQLLVFVVAEYETVLRVVEGEPFRDRFDGIGQALLARLQGGLLGRLARGDLAPGTDHLHRLTVVVADQVLLIAHPAIGAVLLTEAILGDMAAVLEQLGLLGL